MVYLRFRLCSAVRQIWSSLHPAKLLHQPRKVKCPLRYILHRLTIPTGSFLWAAPLSLILLSANSKVFVCWLITVANRCSCLITPVTRPGCSWKISRQSMLVLPMKWWLRLSAVKETMSICRVRRRSSLKLRGAVWLSVNWETG